jgi:cytidylate kinase
MHRPGRIAIDGPAGAGKSTIGEQLARKLGYLYIDTGAMYRAVAWLALRKGVSVDDGPSLAQLAEQAQITIHHPHIEDGRQYTVTVDGQDVTWEIRGTEVTRAVPPVSAHPELRTILIARQREMAHERDGVVMVGRDIGAVVLPDAELKIYLTATVMERARRRYAELEERLGNDSPILPSFEDVLAEIKRRDEIDKDHSAPAHDAIVIMSDNLSVEQVLDLIESLVEDAP